MLLVRELKRILTERAEKTGVNTAEFPLLILGDFNSLPNSGIFSYDKFRKLLLFFQLCMIILPIIEYPAIIQS